MLLKEAGLKDDSMSYPRDEWTQSEGWFNPKLLMKQEGGDCQNLRLPLFLSGPCSGTAEWVEGGSAAEDNGLRSLEELDIVCRKESKVAMATAPPPAFIHHLNVSDDIVWVKGKLITSLSLVIIQGYSRGTQVSSPS